MNFNLSSLFRGISKLSENPAVSLEAADLLTRQGWRLNNLTEDERRKIKPDKEGGLVLQLESDRDTYLIHNGSSGEFKQLKASSGLLMASGSSLDLDSEVIIDGQAQARILILEFDEQGRRIGKTRLPINKTVTYVPATGVGRVMLTLLIQGVGRVVVRNLSVRLVAALRVPFEGPDLLASQGWRLNSRPEDKRPKIEQDNEGGLVLQIESDRNTYLIHNGSSGEFKQLKPGSGILMASGSSLNIASAIIVDGVAQASILILEFDEQDQPVSKTRLPVNTPVTYAPAAGVARVLLTLMIKGSGRVVFRNLSVHPVAALLMPFDAPDLLTHHGWRLNNLWGHERPKIEQDDDGGLVLQIENGGEIYLIHNGSSGEFKQLKAGSGLLIESGSSLNFDSDITVEGEAQVSFLLLEFDEQGRRVGKTRLPINTPVPYAPGVGVERVMLTLMIRGSGRVVVRSLSVHPASTNLTHRILSTLAADMPVSDGSSYSATIPLNVAIVTDEFMYNFYRGALLFGEKIAHRLNRSQPSSLKVRGLVS